ncbi:MAG: insulinase family protein [Chitinophagales bacterium]
MKKNSVFLIAFLWCTTLSAQQKISHELIPFDSNVRTGVLANGLTYYVRKNVKPEHRAELRLVVNAGSMLESDQQQGLAHFCEHMAFNGTTNFKKSELVDFLERTGVRFGADLNAYTSFDETVYMLQIPTDTEKIFLKGIQVLQDWAQGVSFDAEEIDKERGVVVEEWRLGQGASDRMQRKYFPVLFHDSRYADRLPIGKKEIIERAPYDTLISFYRTWYRPDLMAVIAVGDFDPSKVEAQIKEKFSLLKNPKQEKNRTLYPVPDHQNLLVSIATDKEATYTAISVEYKLPNEEVKTIGDYRVTLLAELYNTMTDHRYSELVQQADPPFTYGGSGFGSMVRTKSSYSNFAIVKDNGVERGLQTVLEENERIRRFGFTATELERAKKELLRNTERAYHEMNKTESRNFASEYIRHYLNHVPSPGIEWEYNNQTPLLSEIRLDEVNALSQKWISNGSNCVIVITAPEKEGVVIPSEENIRKIFSASQSGKVTPYIDKVMNTPLIEKQPTPSRVLKETKTELYNITEWTLENGIKVILKPTDFKNDEVTLNGFSWGGTSLYNEKDFMSAVYAPGIISSSGLGSYDAIALEKFLSDKVVSVSPSITELQQSISGSASVSDMEAMLQLVYLYFTAPRKDSVAFQSTLAQDVAFLQNQHSSPEAAFRDTIQLVMNQHNFRFLPVDVEKLKQVNHDRAFEIYKERFSNSGNWTFVLVGSFKAEELKPLIEKYLGGLPAGGKKENYRNLHIVPPTGIVTKNVKKGSEPKSAVRIIFGGPFEYNRFNRNEVNALQRLMSIKLRETMREEMGGVYGVGISPSLKHYPESSYQLTVSFSCSPDNVGKLVAATMQVIDSVKQNGCNATDLLKVKELLLKERELNLKQNNFWMSALVQSAVNGESILELEDYNKQIEALTGADFKRLASKYFNRNNYAQFVLYPEK